MDHMLSATIQKTISSSEETPSRVALSGGVLFREGL
jgi:hypothetical protein